MKIKSFLKKMVSFKMENLIEEYKNNKQNRKEYTADIWNIINNKYHTKNEIVNIFASLVLIILGIIFISVVFKIFSFPLFIISFIGCLMAIRFKNTQCYYVLDEFKKIEKFEEIEEKNFKEKISACNLYIK